MHMSFYNIDTINFDNYGHLNLVILSSSPHLRIESFREFLFLFHFFYLFIYFCN